MWRGSRFLAVRRPPGKPMAGMWEFPGGKLMRGETPADALARELREELGVTPVDAVFWREKTHAYPEWCVRLLFFHVRQFRGEPVPLEGQSLAWLTPDEALAFPFLEADTDIVRALTRPSPPGEDG
jgi:8-oxo-dGTP diphosphatase